MSHYLGIPKFWVLAIIPDGDRLGEIMRKAVEEVLGKSSLFCFQSYQPAKPYLPIPQPTDDLLIKPWRRVGYPDLHIHQA